MAKAKDEKKKPAPAQEVAQVKRTAIQGIEEITDAKELAEYAGAENLGYSTNIEDRGVPLLYIAQKGSPQIDKKQADKFIPDLEFGDMFNNLSREMWKGEGDDGGFDILPCFFRANYNIWTPRGDGGGFHGSEPRDTPLIKGMPNFVHPETKKVRRDIFVLPDGNHAVLTHHYFCVIKDTWEPIIVPMSATQLGASRTWQALIGAQKVQIAGRVAVKPAYMTTFKLKTAYKDDGDNQWYVFNPEIVGKTENPLLRDFCKQFGLACAGNEIKMSAPEGAADTTQGEVEDEPEV